MVPVEFSSLMKKKVYIQNNFSTACFERGNHEGHEFNIFRSEAGGACDCGDASVMNPSGFCERHGLDKVVSEDIPENLLKLPKVFDSLNFEHHTCNMLCFKYSLSWREF